MAYLADMIGSYQPVKQSCDIVDTETQVTIVVLHLYIDNLFNLSKVLVGKMYLNILIVRYTGLACVSA